MNSTASAKSPTLYQNGVIDVFKLFKVFELNIHQVNQNGEVQCVMDQEIGRKVIKITGNLSATNYIEIPNNKFTKSLNYSGRYYYLFFKAFSDKKFSFQLTYVINNDVVVKFTFKFPLKAIKFTRTNSYNVDIPFHIESIAAGNINNTSSQFNPNSWTIFKFDPVEYINLHLANNFKEFGAISGLTSENTVLRSINFWSTIYVRGLYISNTLFNFNTLPKEMAVKVVDQSNPYSNINFLDLITSEDRMREGIYRPDIKEENDDFEEEEQVNERHVNVKSTVSNNKDKIQKKVKLMENYDSSFKNIEKKSKDLKEENLKQSKEDIVKNTIKKLDMTNSKISFNSSEIANRTDEKFNPDLKEVNSEHLRKNMEMVNRDFVDSKKELIKTIFKRDEQKRKPLLPDPMMHLKFILGYTAVHSPAVKFYSLDTNPNSSNFKKQLLFASGNTLVKYDYQDLRQKFYFGHSKSITNYALACEGQILFSCQEGKNSIIRVWRTENGRCIKMLTTPYEKITSMSVSKDSKLLCTVGLESYNKEQIILWDISNLEEIKVHIRQSSHFSINMIKFSPFEQSILVSCGKENIKFWRIKGDHLGGKAVVLNQYARDNHFICLDYDNPLLGDEFNRGRVFIGSNKGCIYQISCSTQELEAIYKIQDSAILSLCVNDAFCATGSLDGFLRVWPIDFKEFLIEAKHDSGVCSVDIGIDALEIVCGTLNGSVGILDIQTKNYKTILRTPPSKVQFMTAHPSGNYLLTIEDDKSVRVWDVENKSEAFQFISTKDPPTAIGVPNNSTFACGFTSGMLKIFDLDKTSILYETKSFNTPIHHLKFIQKDSFLISMNSHGHMSIHDCTSNYMQIKLIKIDEPSPNTDISLTTEEDYFATIGPEANCVIVWNAKTYGMKNRIPINNFFVSKVCLITKNILAVILENCSVQIYSLAAYEGLMIKEFPSVHIKSVNDFLITKNYKYLISGGEEGMIKIWDSKMLYKDKNYISYQQFIGHSAGVKSIICLEQKSLLVTVSENSGIYFWNFLGDVTFCESEITQEFEKFGNLRDMKDWLSSNNSGSAAIKKSTFSATNMSSIKSSHLERTYKVEHNPNFNTSEKKMRINFDSSINQNDTMQILNMLPIQEENLGVDLSYSQSASNFLSSDAFNQTNALNMTQLNADELANKILFTPKYIPTKIEKFVIPKETSDKMSKRLIIGYSTNSIKNSILNKESQWFAFTVNNKIVVEFLEETRSQVILEEHLDEISCLVLSNDGKYLVSGAGCVNKEEMAPICVWDTSTWSLKKRLNFHYKGIQMIKFSGNGKFMISAGNKEEKSICVWNFNNLTVIDSKSLKFPVIDITPEKPSGNYTEPFLYFTTISFEVISFWRMDSNFRLEGFHVKFEDFTHEREEGELLTAIENTPYFDKVKTSFIIIGTNCGAIMIVDKEKKIMLRKYFISKSPITKIFFNMGVDNNANNSQGSLICAGEGPVIYSWKFDANNLDHDYVFDFLEKERSKLIFVDSNVLSAYFTEMEGLVSTDTGSIFFASFQTESAIKIISSHKNCYINSVDSDQNNEILLSCGDDGTVRCWTQDTFDQKFQFMKLNDTKCELALLNHADNMCIVNYDSSYLRIFNMGSLKSVGKLKIPDHDINSFGFIFNYQGLIATTLQDKVFLFDIQNWDPLSVLYTEISNSFMPKNQFFKSIDAKHITPTRSLALMSFSDGTTCVIGVEKSKGKIETSIVDKFNMFEYHISKSDDVHIAEMYQNLTKFRTNYICSAKFSKKYDDFLFGVHECLQFLYIRNYTKNEVYRRIPLNYFPCSISISESEKYIALGTKEGLVLFITRIDHSLQSGFNLDIFPGHYDMVKSINFNYEESKLFSTSHSELLVWNIN